MTTATKTAPSTPSTSIHSRALLVWLTIQTWSARKYDRKISDKVNEQYAASSDAGRYNKFLLPGDAKAYKALIGAAGSIRAAHYSHTLAWSDEGWRLLPTANYMEYTKWFREQQRAFDTALAEFISDYPRMRSAAASLLNGMYKDEDYPVVADMRKRFALRVEYSPLPNFGDVRVELASDQVQAIETSINERITGAVETAMRDAWSRLYESVSKIHDRLSDPEAIFRNSLIDNAKDICSALQRLNVTNDPQLEKMRARVADQLTTFDPDVLRDTKRVRADVASKANAIMRDMAQYYAPEAR